MMDDIKKRIAVGYDHDGLHAAACTLAQQLQLCVDNQVLPRLQVQSEKLVLLFDAFAPLYVDFMSPASTQRRGKQQGLVKACKPKPGLKILDATAGWGRDSAVLVHFGAEVIMLEREPVMAALLEDGLRRFIENSALSANLSLLKRDALEYLTALSPEHYPDVIYLDPMHPERQKSALVKKDMQVLQQLISHESRIEELLQLALLRTKDRVVVKWPQRLLPPLKPNFSFSGKTVRFDVHLKK